ncbi:hypothetical protein [Urechidicola vernalis]|uniref:Uncharacterized protein n=1 Tax=Urechidicola vernalis TaxID=3075600 RepID=A0ABU2Y5U2_9FLAO|nr:hypothetical protein [Urechidicola sp. P050]MDT0552625.1 hypothetical protein [Urechidicola sp. P050]
MRKFIFYLLLLTAISINAQESYFTIYNFSVEPQNEATVYKLVNDYYSTNKTEGVTVSFYENHFNDNGNNFTHSIVFSGSFDDIGNMYSLGNNDAWNLFLTKVNQHIKEGFSSAMGTSIASYGDVDTSHPVQKYILLHVEDGDAFDAAYKVFNSKHNPDGRITMMGNITAGQSPYGENRWVVNGFKDFKAAIGGANKLLSEQALEERGKGWDEFRSTHGGVTLVRTGLRVLLGQW